MLCSRKAVISEATNYKAAALSWLTLFSASGTLLCCAVPIVFVSLGFGGTVAALTSTVPVLIVLSQHKLWVFMAAGTLLLLSGLVLYRYSFERTCPMDLQSSRWCVRARAWNRRLYWTAVTIWGLGFFAAYLVLPLRIALGL